MNPIHPVFKRQFPKMGRSLPAVVLVCIALSCTNGGQAPKLPDTPRDLDSREAPTDVPIEKHKVILSSPKATKLRKVFDFTSNLSRGHLRSKGLLVDFGTPARHKYTLGDWKSGWAGDFEEDGTTYSVLKGPVAHVFFDSNGLMTEGASITFRARPEGGSEVKVYLNGEYVDLAQFSDSGFTHAAVSSDKGIVQGQNELLFRCRGNRRSKSRPGCISVDYIRISADEHESGPAAAAYDSVKFPNASGGSDGILLSQGESLTFNIPGEMGLRLKGKARARQLEGEGQFEISVLRDDGEFESLLMSELVDRNIPLDVDLSKFDGETISLTFSAIRGDVVLPEAWLGAPFSERHGASGELGAKNVVVVLIDTLRTDRLSVYNGQTRVRTPYLDELGQESMIFERAFAPENWTKPSVASLLSGLYPMTHNAKDDRDKVPGSVTLASEHFSKLDFETAGFVANGYVSNKFGFKKGWHTWTNYVREGKANRAKYVVEDAVKWLKNRRSDKPFFLYVHTIDPHVPYIPPQKYLAMYDSGRYSGPIKSSQTAHQLAKIKTGKLKLNERDKIRLEALYDGEISYHDDQLVMLHRALEEEGLLDNTLIVVTSDHGEEFFEHGSVGHGHSLYEELLHVPLIIRLPGASKGEQARSNVEVNLVDVLPTICEILGVECPRSLEGQSLVDLLGGTGSPGYMRANFSEFLSGQRAARIGRYKVIYKGLFAHLYDLSLDPLETDDLRDKSPVTLALMRDTLGMHLGSFLEANDSRSQERKPVGHKREKAVIDKETERQLKALGYLSEE